MSICFNRSGSNTLHFDGMGINQQDYIIPSVSRIGRTELIIIAWASDINEILYSIIVNKTKHKHTNANLVGTSNISAKYALHTDAHSY